MEQWKNGIMVFGEQRLYLASSTFPHYSNIPSFHHSGGAEYIRLFKKLSNTEIFLERIFVIEALFPKILRFQDALPIS